MKKFYAFLSAVLLAATAMATDITFTFNSAEGLQALGITAPEQSKGTDLGGETVTNGIITMTATNGATPTRVWNSQGSYSLRVYQNGSITFTTQKGAIIAIQVTAAVADFFQFTASTGKLELDETTYSWTGSSAAVTLTHTDKKNAQVATVTITVDENATPTDEPGGTIIDPTIEQVDSLIALYDLEDGTEFQFTTEAYVTYQNGQYLYLLQMDDEGYCYSALIYGDAGQEYDEGAVIPAGWKGTKTTYKGLIEITNVSGLQNAASYMEEEDYCAFDSYLSEVADPEYGYENFRVLVRDITLSAIDEKGNFTLTALEEVEDGNGSYSMEEVTVPGYNKWNIDYPTDLNKTYNVEAMVTIFNDAIQLYPIAFYEVQGTPLWNIWYMYQEGDTFQISDTLYVVKATQAADGNRVYVTDNATEIYYDIYEPWIEGEWTDWAPDFIALDCGDDTEMFNALSQMKVLAPGSVRGVIKDFETDLRLELTSVPEEVKDAVVPEINYDIFDIATDEMAPYANNITYIKGYYTIQDGKAYLIAPEYTDDATDGQRLAIDFRYAPNMQNQLEEGKSYMMLAVWKMYEAFEPEDDIDDEGLMVKRRIKYSDPNFYNNVFVCPIGDVAVGLHDARTAISNAPVAIYNMAGQRINRLQKGINIVHANGRTVKVLKK